MVEWAQEPEEARENPISWRAWLRLRKDGGARLESQLKFKNLMAPTGPVWFSLALSQGRSPRSLGSGHTWRVDPAQRAALCPGGRPASRGKTCVVTVR